MLMAPSLLSPWPPFHSAGHQICDPTPHCMRLCCWVPLRKPWPQWSTEPSQGSLLSGCWLTPCALLSLSLSVSYSCSSVPTHLLDSHTCMSLPFCAVCVCSVESWIILLVLNYLEGKLIECAALGTYTPIVKNFPSVWPVCSENLHL